MDLPNFSNAIFVFCPPIQHTTKYSALLYNHSPTVENWAMGFEIAACTRARTMRTCSMECTRTLDVNFLPVFEKECELPVGHHFSSPCKHAPQGPRNDLREDPCEGSSLKAALTKKSTILITIVYSHQRPFISIMRVSTILAALCVASSQAFMMPASKQVSNPSVVCGVCSCLESGGSNSHLSEVLYSKTYTVLSVTFSLYR